MSVRTRMTEEARKAQIIEAAAAVARRQGFAHATVRAVAAEAGVSHGLVLHHFGSMEGLQSALLDWLLSRVLIPQVQDLDDIPPGRRLVTVIERQLEFFDRGPGLMDLLFAFWTQTNEDTTVRERIERRLEAFRLALEPVAESDMAVAPERYAATSSRAVAQVAGMVLLGHEMQRQLRPDAATTASVLAALKAILRVEQGDAQGGGSRG